MIRSRFSCLIVLAAVTVGGCFKASDDGGDEIGDTGTDSTGESDTAGESDTSSSGSTSTESSSTDTTTGDPPDPFVFAADPADAYTRVDRMGMPAIATAVITSKDEYNAANPVDDVNAQFYAEILSSVTGLHDVLDDDVMGVGIVPCAMFGCMDQFIPYFGPDTIKIELAGPQDFPNGRRLDDQAIDITLAAIMIDLSVQGQTPALLADLPLNPPANDVPFLPDFPYLAAPN